VLLDVERTGVEGPRVAKRAELGRWEDALEELADGKSEQLCDEGGDKYGRI
jgi:hypothetical protein